MLVSISIKNFAIVRQLEVFWHEQMTTITGETGAGKSIAIDALAQSLGERSDPSMVRNGADKAEIISEFDIQSLPSAQTWLKEHDLFAENECILRRVISKEGRSQAYINGSKVPASQLKAIGNLLVSIHGQHAHQLLSKPEHQRALLDDYAGNQSLIDSVKSHYNSWQSKHKELVQLKEQKEEFSAQKQLLTYQVEELDKLAIEQGEYELIEQEHKRLHHAQNLLSDSQQALNALSDGDNGNAYTAIQSALSLLYKASEVDNALNPTIELLDSALIQLEEGSTELRRYAESLDLNPERLYEVEQRLNTIIDLARKHQVQPAELPMHHQELANQLAKLSHSDSRLEELESEIDIYKKQFISACEDLTQARLKFAHELNKKISDSMNELNMAGAIFEISLDTNMETANAFGAEKVEFLVSANPGQPLQPLTKVASGGELSRISLAIQVIIAKKVTTPTLLFDEVDVGVSGPTASAVGKLLKRLSNNTQVMCVTHLPQVACFGHQQQFVNKQALNGKTETSMVTLDNSGRIDELARLLGGDQISQTTKANAEELLAIAHAH